MSLVNISSVLKKQLIPLFQEAVSSTSSSSSRATTSLSSSSSSTTISDVLRVGAQTFASSIQTLNSTIGFLNTSKETLQDILKIADKVLIIANRAASANTGSSTRADLNAEFRGLASEFKRVLDNAKIGDYEVLSEEDISGALELVGLDQESSDSIAAIFRKFYLSDRDDLLASEYVEGTRPVRIPPSAANGPIKSQEYGSLFSEERVLKKQADAYYLKVDAEEFKRQIETNIKGIDYALEVVGQNIDLLRGSGFAFLEGAEIISDSAEAEDVANDLQRLIRKNSRAALSQAENLNSIIVATLTLIDEGLTYKKTSK